MPDHPIPTFPMTGVFIKEDKPDIEAKPVKRTAKSVKPEHSKRYFFKKNGNTYEAIKSFQHVRFWKRGGKLIRSFRCVTCNFFVREGEKHCNKCCEMLGIKHEVKSAQKVVKPQCKNAIREKALCKSCKGAIKKGDFCKKCLTGGVNQSKIIELPKKPVCVVKQEPTKNTGARKITRPVNSVRKNPAQCKKLPKKTTKPAHNIRCVACKGRYARADSARCKICSKAPVEKKDIKYSFVDVDDIKDSLNDEEEKQHLSTLDFIEIDDDADTIDQAKEHANGSGHDTLEFSSVVCDEEVVGVEPEPKYYVSMSDITRMMVEDA